MGVKKFSYLGQGRKGLNGQQGTFLKMRQPWPMSDRYYAIIVKFRHVKTRGSGL